MSDKEVQGVKNVHQVRGAFDDVESEKSVLIYYRDRVKEKVEAIDDTIEIINDGVLEWLQKTNTLLLEMESPTIQVKPQSLMKIYALNVKFDDLINNFSSPVPSLEHFYEGNMTCFSSREEISNELLQVLKDDKSFIIGLYGRQGYGKKTLVKAIAEKLKYLKIFKEVLFVTTAQNPDIKKMQDEIASALNIKFDKSSRVGRAINILSTIETLDRRILVIFIDVQAKFDPEDVGIPSNCNRCKVLLTTCRQEECESMSCQKVIHLPPLSNVEIWTLFKKHLGIHDRAVDSGKLELLNVAYSVAFLCEGLPGTIKKVGSSLKGRPIKELKTSLSILRRKPAKWHVFLSFRGDDTRYTFTGNLSQALRREGLKTFFDEEGVQTGHLISPSLLDAIETSRLSIVVLSENYANSTWCLDELVKILECMRINNQLVWPIFYKVEPTDIRNQNNSYGKAMAEHEVKFGKDYPKIKKWRSALYDVSLLSGIPYTTTGYEYKVIQNIVDRVNRIRSNLQIRSD